MDHIENPEISHLTFEAFQAAAPASYQALIALSRSAGDSGLDKKLTELVKIRTSQLNGCAFCIQHHLNLARTMKVPAAKLDLVAAWREAGIFTPRERAALAWAEHLAGMAAQHVPDGAYAAMRAHFSESEATFLTVAIASINAWNRIAGALRFPPAVAQEA